MAAAPAAPGREPPPDAATRAARRAARRQARLDAELDRLDGNRLWVVDTPRGRVLQKLYAERGGALRCRVRDLLARLRGGKSGTRAAARRATERRLLALWRAAGCEVPRDLSDEHADLVNKRTLVLEWVEGPLLSRALREAGADRARRDALLERFGADCRRRHDLALQRGEPGLVQEHGGVQHVIVAGDAGAPRLVTFDLESAFAPRRDLLPLLAKEVAATLRSLAKAQGRDFEEGAFRADVRAFVRGYGERARLAACAAHYLRPRGFTWVLWALDRALEEREEGEGGKYDVLSVLQEVLAS
jgi:hypothetical protein